MNNNINNKFNTNKTKSSAIISSKKTSTRGFIIGAGIIGVAALFALPDTSIDFSKFNKAEKNDDLSDIGNEWPDNLVYSTYPQDLMDVKDFAVKLSKKESNYITQKGWDYECSLTNRNSIYMDYSNGEINEVDQNANIVKTFNLVPVGESEYISNVSIQEIKDNNLIIKYVLVNEESKQETLFVSKYNEFDELTVLAKKDINNKSFETSFVIYDENMDEFLLVSSIDDNTYNFSIYSDQIGEIASHNIELNTFISKENVIFSKGIGYLVTDTQGSFTITYDKVTKDKPMYGGKNVNSIHRFGDAVVSVYNYDIDSYREESMLSVKTTDNTYISVIPNNSYVNHVWMLEDGYVAVFEEHHSSEETGKDKAVYGSSLYKIVRYNENGEEIWSHYFGDMDKSNSSSFGTVNFKNNGDSLVFTGDSYDKNSEEYLKFEISIDEDGNITSLL